MTELYLRVDMEPEPKGRARSTIDKDGKPRTYTPGKTVKAESMIRETWRRCGSISFDAKTPLALSVLVIRTRPRSLPKKVTWPVTRPDWDNYGKLVCDALNKFAYHDDAQIIIATVKKKFGSPPGLVIIMQEVKEL